MLPGTHLALACPVVLALSMPFSMNIGFLIGSVLPDKLDFFFSGGNFQTWTKIHRTFTHTWWILLLCLFSLFLISSRSDIVNIAVYAGKGIFLGMLYHTLCDILTPMGIPILSPMGRKYGIGIIASRGFRATMLCTFCIFLSVWLVYLRFFSDSQFLTIANEFVDRLKLVFPQVRELFGKLAELV